METLKLIRLMVETFGFFMLMGFAVWFWEKVK
jgi:hypothetical protein